jgi:RND family efflux transporter MFP subunit
LVRFDIPGTAAELQRQQAEVGRAQAALDAAMAARNRARDLFERGVAARRDMEESTRAEAEAEALLAQARAALAAAQNIAARSVVRATFDGIIVKRLHNPGDLVEAAAGDQVLRVIDPRRLEVVASVPLADAPRVKAGAQARLTGLAPGAEPVALKTLSRPVAVDPGTATVPVRLAFTGPPNLPAGAPVQVEIEAEHHTGVLLVPTAAVLREAGETAVFVAKDQKAHRHPVQVGLADGSQVEILGGLQPGDQVIVDGQAGLPDDTAIAIADTPATASGSSADRPGARTSRSDRCRARPTALAGARPRHHRVGRVRRRRDGLLPSAIYPPLQFPRIVIVAHAGTLPPASMSLIVTRPLEQAVIAVPGVRRVRSRSIRGAAEISAQFDPATDMVVALQMVQNRVAEIGTLPSDTQLQIERMTPQVFPVFILSLTGHLPTADLYDYANFVLKPELARVPGAGPIEVQASDTREIEVILDPVRLAAAELTVSDVAGALKAQNTVVAGGALPGVRAAAPGAGVRLVDQPRRHRTGAREVKNGTTVRVADVGTVTRGAPRPHPAHHRERTRRRLGERRPTTRCEHPRVEGRRGRRAGRIDADASFGHHDQPRLRPRRVRRGSHHERP